MNKDYAIFTLEECDPSISRQFRHLVYIPGVLIGTALDTIFALGNALIFVASFGFWNNRALAASKYCVSMFTCAKRLHVHTMGFFGCKYIDKNKKNIIDQIYGQANTEIYKFRPIKLSGLLDKLTFHVLLRFGAPVMTLIATVALVVAIPLTFLVAAFSIIPTPLQKKSMTAAIVLTTITGLWSASIIPGLFSLVDPKNMIYRIDIFGGHVGKDYIPTLKGII